MYSDHWYIVNTCQCSQPTLSFLSKKMTKKATYFCFIAPSSISGTDITTAEWCKTDSCPSKRRGRELQIKTKTKNLYQSIWSNKRLLWVFLGVLSPNLASVLGFPVPSLGFGHTSCFLSVFREERSVLDKTRQSDFSEYPLPLQPGAYWIIMSAPCRFG